MSWLVGAFAEFPVKPGGERETYVRHENIMSCHCDRRDILTYIEIVPGMLQDELSGVWLVLAVIHVHLEFIGL